MTKRMPSPDANLALYDLLREANPWMPDPDHVVSVSLTWGRRGELPTATLELHVNLPEPAEPTEDA